MTPEALKRQHDAQRRIHEETLDRITIYVPKGQKDVIREYATSKGMSVNAIVNYALKLVMENDLPL